MQTTGVNAQSRLNGKTEDRCRIGFVIEQALGHVTHGLNLRKIVDQDKTLDACWIVPDWEPTGFGRKIPVYKSNWTVRAGLLTRRGLATSRQKGRLDALFFHTQVTAVLSQDWMRSIPSIVSLDATPYQYDGLGQFYTHARGSAWSEKLKWKLNQSCFRTAHKLVTWSEWARQSLIDDYQILPDKITVIPPGLDIQEWCLPEVPLRSEKIIKILFVGGDLKRKGGDLLIDAFRALRTELSSESAQSGLQDLELHLVTKDVVEKETGIFVYNHMQPNSPELKHLFAECDVFCLPTYADTLGIAAMEAGAAGLPVIATRLAGIPEVVLEGKTGFLISPGNVVELVVALRTLVMNKELRLEMGRKAVDYIQHRFDSHQNTTQLTNLLKESVKGH